MRNILEHDHTYLQLILEKDLIPFSMFYAIHNAKDPFIITNDLNIIMGQERTTSPLWIYIKNPLTQEQEDSLITIILERLKLNANLSMEGYGHYLAPILQRVAVLTQSTYQENLPKNAYMCSSPVCPPELQGMMGKALASDLQTITVFCKDNWKDIGFGDITLEQAYNLALRKLTTTDLRLWKVNSKDTVAMAAIHRYGDIAITDSVFTARNQRGKGYGKALMYALTTSLLNEGITPVLYADRRNQKVNHVYKSIGYDCYGEITQYKFSS